MQLRLAHKGYWVLTALGGKAPHFLYTAISLNSTLVMPILYV